MSTYSGLHTRHLLSLTLISLVLASGCGDLWPLDSDITCGNRVVDADNGEVCDGADVGGKTCKTEGFSGGTLKCKAGCMALDNTGCYYLCGDGKQQTANSEVCDGADLGSKTCKTEAYTGGTLKCKTDCSALDTSDCYKCGDGVKHALEPCDGTNLGGLTCAGGGYAGGVLGCKKDCSGLDLSGCYVWGVDFSPRSFAKSSTTSPKEYGHAIAVDSAGNRYIAGAIDSSLKVGSSSVSSRGGGLEAIVVKLDSSGKGVWAWVGGSVATTDSPAMARGIAVDSGGYSYVTGSFTGKSCVFDVNAKQPKDSKGGKDLFVVKLDKNGKVQWATFAGAAGDEEGHAIALDGKGGVVLTGSFQGSVPFGSTTLTAQKDSAGKTTGDIFVARLDAAKGAFSWATALGSAGSEQGKAIAVDSTGNSYVAGSFDGKITYDKTASPPRAIEPTPYNTGGSAYSEDIFVISLDSAGKVRWATATGSKHDNESANAIALDGAGGLVLTGAFAGATIFGSTTLSASLDANGYGGGTDFFLAWMTTAGSFTKAIAASGTGNDAGHGLAVASNGNIHLTGHIGAPMNSGSFYLSCAGNGNLFMAELDSTGRPIRAAAPITSKRGGSSDSNTGRGVAVDSNGRGLMVGDFDKAITVGDQVLTADGSSDLVVLSLYTTPYMFEAMTSGTTEGLRSVWGSGPRDVYAVGNKAALHFDGSLWSPIKLGTAPGDLNLFDVWGSGPKDVVMVGKFKKKDGKTGGVIYQYDGTTWTSRELTKNSTDGLSAVGGSGKDEVYALGMKGKGNTGTLMVYKRASSGWTPTELDQRGAMGFPQFIRVWASGPGDVWAAGGGCYKGCSSMLYRLQGGKWGTVNIKAGQLSGIWGTSASNVYVSGYNVAYPSGTRTGTVLRYDGKVWTSALAVKGGLTLALKGTSATDIWVAMEKGKLMHNDGTANWTGVPTPTSQDLKGLWSHGKTELFAVGRNGAILRKR